MGLSIFDEQFPISKGNYLGDSDGTDPANLIGADQRPARVDHIWVTNNDTIDHVLTVSLHVGGSGYAIGSVTVPLGTGYAGVRCIDLIQELCDPAIDGIALKPGDAIYANNEVACNTGKVVTFASVGGELY